MSVSVRIRFEVFKRDRFTCAYCGKHPPDVLLEVDHIVPQAAGGSDDMENLITACLECNRGKSDRLLDEGQRPVVHAEAVADLEERIAQAQAYAELTAAMGALAEKQVGIVIKQWARAFRASTTERESGTYWELARYEEWPNEGSIRLFIRKLPLAVILEAVDIAGSRFDESSNGACRYFYAICWKRIRDLEGES